MARGDGGKAKRERLKARKQAKRLTEEEERKTCPRKRIRYQRRVAAAEAIAIMAARGG